MTRAVPCGDARLAMLAIALLVAGEAAAMDAPRPPRRWVLSVGENRGLPADEPLRYAGDDALRVRDALVDVGGVQPGDATLLTAARADAVRAALERTRGALAAAGPGDSLVVYVSAHADERALHLDGTTLPLVELVEFVKAAPVDVAVLVIDSCHSGAVTRTKGLKVVDATPVQVDASGVQGRVFISASGVDEYAQESDELRGSTFTHHLVAGLRGAADSSRDGRVTIEELYAFAWARTMEATFGSRGGVQRPAFHVDLRGQGQVVLATPGDSPGRLTLDVAAPGRWLVVQGDTGAVVAELEKPPGPLVLGVPPGPYHVRLRTPDGVLERRVVVPARGGAAVGGEELERASRTRVALKGGPAVEWLGLVGAGATSGLVNGLDAEPGVELGLRRGDPSGEGLDDATLSLAARTGRSSGAHFRQDELELRLGLGHRVALSRVSLAVGGELGALLVLQSELPGGGGRTGLEGFVNAVVEGRLVIVRPVGLVVALRGGPVLVQKDAGLAVVPRFGATAGLSFAF